MIRIRRTRIDFIIPFIIAFAFGALINEGAKQYIQYKENEEVETEFSDTKIGAAADKNVPVVSSIDEMMQENVFTFHLDPMFDYELIFADEKMYYLFTLQSEETVLVDLYFDNISWGYYGSGDESEDVIAFNREHYAAMPVGKTVKKPLTPNQRKTLAQKGLQVTDSSFYIDMHGDYQEFDAEAFLEKAHLYSALTGIAVFFLIRWLMISSGLFAPLFPLRFMRKWKRFVSYNGILYYDENIKEIHKLHKHGNINAAAQEFCKLTSVSMEEAMQAMEYWSEIYGEGILNITAH